MTKIIKIAFVVAGIVLVNAANYQNSTAPFAPDMECANCIRAGFDYCLYIGGEGNGTITKWDCNEHPRTPEWNITSPQGGVPGGYMCSGGMADQMNAIVNGCRPWLNQNLVDYCGSYFVDLTDSNEFRVGRSIEQMPVNTSCSYRAISNCGYPEAEWRVHDTIIQTDFDVAWATMDDLDSGNELDGWEPETTTEWNGSYGTNAGNDFSRIGVAAKDKANVTRIVDQEWTGCKSKPRNLWLTITRVKNSKPANQGLAQTARQLIAGPYYPNGSFSSDFEVNFYNNRGPAVETFAKALVGAFGVAIAGLAALAF